MYKRIMTIAVAAMFIVGAFIVTMDANDSEAVTAGSMNIYVYDGEGWTDYTDLSGYNALQALQASAATFVAAEHYESTTSTTFSSTDYVIQKSNDWGTYDEINSNYGDVFSINDVEEDEDNVWSTYYYDGSSWVAGPDAIGFIVPFNDGALSSANVVLYYNMGETETTILNNIATEMSGKTLKSVINVLSTDVKANYEMEFYIKVSTTEYTPTIASSTTVEYKDGTTWTTKTLEVSDLTSGITVRGYGSNAYAAFKNAIGAGNVDGQDTYGPYNGWITTVFGLGTVSGITYTYWVQTTSSSTYLSFNMGAYSTLDNVPTDYVGTTTTLYNMVGSSYNLEYC